MNAGILWLVVGGFLLGGAWSVWRSDPDTERPAARTGVQVALAVVLLLAAGLATASGILRL